MNNQTKTQENVKKALAKQTLGLPLTPHEHALVTLYGQSPVQQKENKPEFVEKYLNGYIEEKDDTFYPTCRFCGKQTLPDAPYLSQNEANEAATIRCDCFEAREYQEKLRKEKERADNIIKLRQRLDDFSEYSASRGVELTGELHDLLLNVGIAIIDGQILKANINVGRIKVSISSNSKSVLTICFTYSDGAKLEV